MPAASPGRADAAPSVLGTPLSDAAAGAGPREGGWLGTHDLLARVVGVRHTRTEVVAAITCLSTGLMRAVLAADPRGPHTGGERWVLPVLQHGATPFCDARHVLQQRPSSSMPGLLARLPRTAGVRQLPGTSYVGVDLTRQVTYLDARHAFTREVTGTGSGWLHDRLAALAAALGDPGNQRGALGLSGLAALDPSRLYAPRGTPARLDLVLFPAAARQGLDVAEVLRSAGAVLAADLATGDPRLIRYQAHRRSLGTTTTASDERLRARRADIAWLGNVQLDLTRCGPRRQTRDLPYAAPPLYRTTRRVTVADVIDSCPVTLQVTGAEPCTELVVGAAGFQTVFRPGDRITAAGAVYGDPTDPGRPRWISVDDHTGHRITCTGARRRRPSNIGRPQ